MKSITHKPPDSKPEDDMPPFLGQELLRMLLSYADMAAAKKLLTQQTELNWDHVYGAEVETLELDIKAMEASYEKSTSILLALEDKKRNTKPYIKAAAVEGEASDQRRSFSSWRLKDKIVAVSSLSAAVMVLGTGSANVYSNIMSSGNVIFLEQPSLALLLSILLPAGAVAIKFVVDYFESDRSRRLYILFMYGLTVLMLLLWTVLFALSFHGVSGGLDLDALGETDHFATAFTGVQLLAEMLVGSTLFQVASDTHARYAPESYVRNPEYLEIQQALTMHGPDHEALRQERNATRSRLVALQAARQSYVNSHVIEFTSMHSRLKATSPNAH